MTLMAVDGSLNGQRKRGRNSVLFRILMYSIYLGVRENSYDSVYLTSMIICFQLFKELKKKKIQALNYAYPSIWITA